MLRSVIEAAPGHMLVSCDLSQIEARVLVWLAGQDDVTELFRRDEDVYTYTAKSLGSDNRQFGKVLVLATGFGMGPRRFRDTARTFGVTLTEGEAEDAVAGWRGLNHHVVHMWWEAHKIALAVAAGPVGSAVSFRGMVFARRSQSLDIVLPSGRALVYREPQVRRHPDHGHLEFVYRGVEQGRWAWVRSWPGKLTENIVQAIARDVMAEAIIKVHRRGPPLIATVHDELISEVPQARAEDARDWLSRAMNRAPVWAPGLPVAAAATIGRRYRKDA
jgi:DNA polymerase